MSPKRSRSPEPSSLISSKLDNLSDLMAAADLNGIKEYFEDDLSDFEESNSEQLLRLGGLQRALSSSSSTAEDSLDGPVKTERTTQTQTAGPPAPSSPHQHTTPVPRKSRFGPATLGAASSSPAPPKRPHSKFGPAVASPPASTVFRPSLRPDIPAMPLVSPYILPPSFVRAAGRVSTPHQAPMSSRTHPETQRSRRQEYQLGKRMKVRQQSSQRQEEIMAATTTVPSAFNVSAVRSFGGFEGMPYKSLPALPKTLNLRTIPAGPGLCNAVDFVDSSGVVCAHRGYENEKTPSINTCLQKGQRFLQEHCPKPEYVAGHPKHTRGNFNARTFTIHASSQRKPTTNAYYKKHAAVATKLAEIIEPAIRVANGLVRRRYPLLYEELARIMKGLREHPELKHDQLPQLWGVFSSFCMNGEDGEQVWTSDHTDRRNKDGSVCIVVSLGAYDPVLSALLCLPDLEVAIELPPGVPCAIMSAVLRHFNTAMRPGEWRGSAVFWLAGATERWLLHGGMVKELKPKERREWEATAKSRARVNITFLPVVPLLSASGAASSFVHLQKRQRLGVLDYGLADD